MRILKQKLDVTDLAVYTLLASSKILSVQMQGEDLCMWFSVDENEEEEYKKFYIHIHGTGHVFSPSHLTYIGTVQVMGGALVYHVFHRESN